MGAPWRPCCTPTLPVVTDDTHPHPDPGTVQPWCLQLSEEPLSWAVIRLCVCVCEKVAVNSCQASFPCAPWDLQGPAREPVSGWNRPSVCLLPRAPVRGLACLCVSGVTQSVHREQRCRLREAKALNRPQLRRGPRGRRLLTGRWTRVTGDPGGTRGCRGLMPGAEHVRSDSSFLRAKGP